MTIFSFHIFYKRSNLAVTILLYCKGIIFSIISSYAARKIGRRIITNSTKASILPLIPTTIHSHPFTAPAVIPSITFLFRIVYSTSIGSTLMETEAKIAPQFLEPNSSWKYSSPV